MVNISDPAFRIRHQTRCLFIGSCFTETIGERMVRFKFPALYNPFGVLYNPASISKGLRILMLERQFTGGDLLFHNGLWLSLNHDTSFSNPDKEQCLAGINASMDSARSFLKQCRFLFITLGTAWVYVYKETGDIVANCHKIPAAAFERKLLETGDILKDYQHLIEDMHLYNPDIQIIFTVSPIRHLKDGAFNNQVSKSVLLLTIHKLQDMHRNIHYFPAYEIFMDELRDYRFYADDMLHPSGQGIAYIWDRFCNTYLDESSIKIMADVEKIHKALTHRPFQPDSSGYKSFIEDTLQQVKQLQKTYPDLDFNAEIKKLTEKTTEYQE